MSVVIGSGEYRYRVDMEWARLPDGWSFKDVAAVAVDLQDNVYVFNRGEHPMIVFDREGNFLRSFGEVAFTAWPRFTFAGDAPPPADLRTLRKLIRIRD